MTVGENHQTPTYYGWYEILYSTLYRLGNSPGGGLDVRVAP
jgi:hypothetical protein